MGTKLAGGLGINFLPKIALLVEQTNSDNRDAQVACGFELIAGNVAESARINRQRFAQHELHREIRNVDTPERGCAF
jgi:hypothetical protein